MTNRYQCVILSGQESNWMNIHTGVPQQGSVLSPLIFHVSINNLSDNIDSEMCLFADNSSMFACVKGVRQTHQKFLKDLETITSWVYQWKMVFNPDITKQAIEVILYYKDNSSSSSSFILLI